ncbi:MAG: hypothetical protein JO062_05570 [Bryobacterales bacterium]|nr:hypothetical protein [Bryobacterales bacterium]
MWLVPIAMCLVAGWFLARALTAGAFGSARWLGALTELSLAALFGPGLASILYVPLLRAGAATQTGVLAMLAALLAGSALIWWRITPKALPGPSGAKKLPWAWALGVFAAVGLIFLILDFQAAAAANPNGEWDAMAIWNLRARFLASSGELWRRAISSEIGGGMAGAAHPGYPLFLSGFIALQWIGGGTIDQASPIVTSLLFSLGVFLLLGCGIAARKSLALGALACLVLAASEVFASQTSAQYSDLLQGFAFLATLVLLEAATGGDSPRLLIAAGLAAGLSAWIKNEGLPFAVAALAIGAWKFRSRSVWIAAGAAPGLLATAFLKLFLAQGHEAVFPQTLGEAVAKIAGPGRWWQAGLGFGKAIYDAGAGITHPVLLAALLGIVLRFIPAKERRARAWLWIPLAVTAAAEYSLYLVTEANLDWHISTSVSRLVAQLWPALIWLFLWMLRTPEELVETVPQPAAKPRVAKRARA